MALNHEDTNDTKHYLYKSLVREDLGGLRGFVVSGIEFAADRS